MNELVERIAATIYPMWRFRWYGVAAAWAVAVASALLVIKIPDRYEASARIFVDTQKILRPLMSGLAVQPNIDQQVAMLGRTLISRPNVEKVAQMAGLDLSDGVDAKSERRIAEVMKNLQIQSLGNNNLYTLTYRDSTPERAKRVVESLVSIFVQSSLGASRKDSDAAKSFIDEQIQAYRATLEQAEARLKEFRIQTVDLQTLDGRDAATRMAELGAQLDAARLQLREAEQSREAARASLESEKASAGNAAVQGLLQESTITASTPELDARIDAQQRNLDSLLQRYTEQHPDVIAARRLVKELEEQRSKERAAQLSKLAHMPIPQVSNNSLAYQELTRLAATADVQLAAARARVAEYQSRMEQARVRLKDAPKIEAELARLNRDYAIQKKAYDELVARRESADMAGRLDDASGLAEFRIIEPPRLPELPVSPNRPLLLLGALVLSVASGVGLAFLLSQVWPVFHRANELYAHLGIPVLGAVGAIRSESDLRSDSWDRMKLLIATGLLFAASAIGILASALRHSP